MVSEDMEVVKNMCNVLIDMGYTLHNNPHTEEVDVEIRTFDGYVCRARVSYYDLVLLDDVILRTVRRLNEMLIKGHYIDS